MNTITATTEINATMLNDIKSLTKQMGDSAAKLVRYSTQLSEGIATGMHVDPSWISSEMVHMTEYHIRRQTLINMVRGGESEDAVQAAVTVEGRVWFISPSQAADMEAKAAAKQ